MNFIYHQLNLLKLALVACFYLLCSQNECYPQDKKALSLDQSLTKAELIRIDSIIGGMSLEEKVNMLYGSGLFTSAGVSRLGIRELTYADGPLGVREELDPKSWTPLKWTTDSATYFPAGTALAATWNPSLAYQFGTAVGEESRTRNKDVLLAPAINITRTPLNGRTFEYLSEDPLLNAQLSVGFIKGVQDRGVAACVKHYAVNNQETERGRINVEVDERALQEIYLPAFKASIIEAKAFAVMAAYNKFRGEYCAESKYLLQDILKKEWGFEGIVMSDWGGTHSTKNSALNGLDVEMGSSPRNIYFSKPLLDSVLQGVVPVEVINDKVKRILKVLFFAMKKDNLPKDKIVSTPEHCKTAYDLASQSIVLLENKKNLLPLDFTKIKSIAVIGENAVNKHANGGFGAGVKTRYEISPLEALKTKFGKQISINYAKGYTPGYRSMPELKNNRVPKQEINPALLAEAIEAAKNADIALVFVGTNRIVESESYDRVDLKLPFAQDSLIKAVVKANPKTIVVVVAGAPLDLNSSSQLVPAILWSWFNGSEGGNALADVLSGKVNPSGKLPFTIPVKLEDSPAHALNTFPGTELTANYKEGILVGYRWFDTKKILPKYCFGYGLSYTTFDFKKLKADKKEYNTKDIAEVTITVKNSGKRAGFETVQLYVSDLNGNVPKAAKELKAFTKVFLNAGEEQKVVLKVKISDLAYFDEKSMSWIVNPGKYRILAGNSSDNCPVAMDVSIK